MCGICGIVFKDKPVREKELRLMNMVLRHRGPDEEGYHLEESVGLGHRRLSIIDVSGGTQPIYNERKNMCIVFNGEIYNYRELRKDLLGRGHAFTTESDTEVVLHLYEDEGVRCLDALRGMFAFAIWDVEERELLLARDRVGKKPLYYAEVPGGILFASEMKSLLMHPLILREMDYDSLRDFLTYNYIPAPKTILRDVWKLEAGHFLLWKEGVITKRRYWQVAYSPKLETCEGEAIEKIRYLLDDAVKVRLESEVPIGVLLSGGIDSASVVAVMRRHVNGDLHTFTIGFEEEKYSELTKARLTARQFGTKHEEFIVRPSAIEVLPKLVWHFDEPFGDSSAVPTYYVSKMARKKVTVVLNGDGGDESFFGYERYLPPRKDDLMSKWRRIPRIARSGPLQIAALGFFKCFPLHPVVQRVYFGNTFSMLGSQEAYVSDMKLLEDELIKYLAGTKITRDLWKKRRRSALLETMREDEGLKLEDQIIRTDMLTYLPGDLLVKMDRMSMANSLEARSPFLDHHLIQYAAMLPLEVKFKKGNLKYILKKALRGIVPDAVLDGKKLGFAAPIERWFKNDLKRFSEEILLAPETIDRGLFDRRFVERLLKEHQSGRRSHHPIIWSLLNVEIWCRTFLDRADISSGAISL